MTDDPHSDLIETLRQRVADPSARLELESSGFFQSVSKMGLSSMFDMLRDLKGDLDRVVQAGPEGPPPDVVARAESLGRVMNEPANDPLPAPCDHAAVDAAERELGLVLPPLLRRLYTEVANGGFGPGYGLIGLPGGWPGEHGESIIDLHRIYSEVPEDEYGGTWPEGLVPICNLGCGMYECVDTTDPAGRIVEFDPEDLDPDEPELWDEAFRETAPSLGAWLQAWLDD